MLINFGAVVASMVLSVALGFLWYGPVFGKQWMKLSGIQMPDGKPSISVMIKPIILSLVGSFLMSSVLSFSLVFHNTYYGTTGILTCISFAFVLWLGFIAPAYLNLTGWEGKPWKLFFINAGYWLVFLLISAMLISFFAGMR